MNTHELAWAAGFFDGEGHIKANSGFRKKAGPRKVYSGVVFEVCQKNPLLLERLKRVFGVGDIYGPYRNNKDGHNFSYRYLICKFEHVQYAIACMWQWLGPIKRDQARKAITNYTTRVRLKTGRKPRSEFSGTFQWQE